MFVSTFKFVAYFCVCGGGEMQFCWAVLFVTLKKQLSASRRRLEMPVLR
jgi:hypothetical protein